MNRSRLLLAVASILAGTTALFVVLGAVYSPVIAVLAAPFGVAAYFIWLDATGRLAERVRARRVRRGRATAGRARVGARTGDDRPRESPSRREARRVLGVEAGADAEAVRRAYRERVKDVHPDASGGDERAFKRVTAAYEHLRE